MFGSQAGAGCGDLCDAGWWKTAPETDLQAELCSDADVMARDEFGSLPLHWHTSTGTSVNIQVLLDAGVDLKAKKKDGKIPWEIA